MTIAPALHPEFIQNLVKTLRETTSQTWEVEIVKGPLGETIADKEAAALAEQQRDVLEYPLVRAIMAEFKGAKIESLIRRVQQSEDDEAEDQPTTDMIEEEETE